MAGETIRAEAICLRIRPFSRTSHMVTWLTRENGPVVTVVKGACRAKSFFLGQYDLYYTCEIVYYARTQGEAHALRECVPMNLREDLRNNWRRIAYAGYAAYLAAEYAPHGVKANAWFAFLEQALDEPPDIVKLEMRFLELAGLKPDFSGWKSGDNARAAESTGALDSADAADVAWMPFSLEDGVIGVSGRTVRLARGVRDALQGATVSAETRNEAIRFLGLFLSFHAELAPDIRRLTLRALSTPLA